MLAIFQASGLISGQFPGAEGRASWPPHRGPARDSLPAHVFHMNIAFCMSGVPWDDRRTVRQNRGREARRATPHAQPPRGRVVHRQCA